MRLFADSRERQRRAASSALGSAPGILITNPVRAEGRVQLKVKSAPPPGSAGVRRPSPTSRRTESGDKSPQSKVPRWHPEQRSTTCAVDLVHLGLRRLVAALAGATRRPAPLANTNADFTFNYTPEGPIHSPFSNEAGLQPSTRQTPPTWAVGPGWKWFGPLALPPTLNASP